MTESVGAFIDHVKDLALEWLFRHGPWFLLSAWLLIYGFPALVDKINDGYREFKADIAHSIDRLADSIDKSTEEQRLFRMQVSGILDGRTRPHDSSR